MQAEVRWTHRRRIRLGTANLWDEASRFGFRAAGCLGFMGLELRFQGLRVLGFRG